MDPKNTLYSLVSGALLKEAGTGAALLRAARVGALATQHHPGDAQDAMDLPTALLTGGAGLAAVLGARHVAGKLYDKAEGGVAAACRALRGR